MKIIGAVAILAMSVAMPAHGQVETGSDDIPGKGGRWTTGSRQASDAAHGKLDIGPTSVKADGAGCGPSNRSAPCVRDLPWRSGSTPSAEPRWLQK